MKPEIESIPPNGYFVAYGGATEEGDYAGGEGWFYGPSELPTKFFKTREEAVAAAWKEHKAT